MILEDDKIIKLSSLPENILAKIPYSIKTYKQEYKLSELPFNIQYIVKEYLTKKIDVYYDLILDCKPSISEYGDFQHIEKIFDLIVEYVKNYIQIQPGDYPYDPNFGCKLKKYIHKLDTTVQKTFISEEVENIARIFVNDMNIDIKIVDFTLMKSTKTGIDVEYNFKITLKVNDVVKDIMMVING